MVGERVPLQGERENQILNQDAGRTQPVLEPPVLDGDHARQALHGLPNHTGKEGGRGGGWLTGPHRDGGEAADEGVNKAPTVVLVDEVLAHHLLRAVGTLRGGALGLVDGLLNDPAVDRLARRKDNLDTRASLAQSVEEYPRCVKVYPHSCSAYLNLATRAEEGL